MDKETFQKLINSEHDTLLGNIDLFRLLLPHAIRDSSVHTGEEGRFIELTLSQYLKDKLPNGIGVGSGFVVDVESGWNSKQMDILLYDKMNFAPILAYGDAVVLPLQSIIAAISVKRSLYKQQLNNELKSLTEIGSRCDSINYPKPYLSLVAFDCEENNVKKAKNDIFNIIKRFYEPRIDIKNRRLLHSWNELIDSVIVFDKLVIRGQNLEDETNKKANIYRWTGGNETKRNFYIQTLLGGIHRSWYNTKRSRVKVGEILAFPSGGMEKLGEVQICCIRRKYTWDKFKPKLANALANEEK